jgi:peroxiredoxin
VSVDPPEVSEALRRRLGLSFTFLSDPDGALLDLLNVRHRGARRDGADIAYPAQILVDRDGIVRWTFQSSDLRVRARPADVFEAIGRLEAGAGDAGGAVGG